MRRLIPSFLLLLLPACEHPTAPGDTGEPLLAAASTMAPSSIDEEFARISREEIPGFGGHYFDEEGNSVVYLSDMHQRAKAERWVREFRHRRGLPPGQLILKEGNYDFGDLIEWRDRLSAFVGSDGVFSLDIDETRNRLRIGLEGDLAREAVMRHLPTLSIPTDAVTLVTEPPPELRLTLRDRFRPLDGGFQIQNGAGGTCTLGFNARQNGKRVFVTASHCSIIWYSSPDSSAQYQPRLSRL